MTRNFDSFNFTSGVRFINIAEFFQSSVVQQEDKVSIESFWTQQYRFFLTDMAALRYSSNKEERREVYYNFPSTDNIEKINNLISSISHRCHLISGVFIFITKRFSKISV